MHRCGIIAVVAFLASSAVPVGARAVEKSSLDVSKIEFGPIQEGKSTVRLKVRNTSDRDQTFGIDIRAEGLASNWQRQFLDIIPAGETKGMSYEINVPAPVTASSLLRLRFFNPAARLASSRDLDRNAWFREEKFYGKEFTPASAAPPPRIMPASKRQTRAVTRALEEFQSHLKNREPEQAWKIMSEDFQNALAKGSLEQFKADMDAKKQSIDLMINLRPLSVTKKGDLMVVHATYDDAPFQVFFVEQDRRWKICGGTRGAGDWQARLLPTMEKRVTPHFDIYFFKDSTAAKEIDQIAKQRENGYREICRFLGEDSDVRLRIVLFEDGKTKRWQTGHQGAGWAVGTTIVEIYNENEKLDPYHEAVHILMSTYGQPPAIFNEGFAVYMSERLGAEALGAVGGGQLPVHQRARDLKKANEWIELEELLTYNQIGSKQSRPPVAYPEAGSFVKFLIDAYGKEKFLRAYGTLKNSSNKALHDQNRKTLEQIYGKPLRTLAEEWETAFSAGGQ